MRVDLTFPDLYRDLLIRRLNDFGCQDLAHAGRELGQVFGRRLWQ